MSRAIDNETGPALGRTARMTDKAGALDKSIAGNNNGRGGAGLERAARVKAPKTSLLNACRATRAKTAEIKDRGRRKVFPLNLARARVARPPEIKDRGRRLVERWPRPLIPYAKKRQDHSDAQIRQSRRASRSGLDDAGAGGETRTIAGHARYSALDMASSPFARHLGEDDSSVVMRATPHQVAKPSRAAGPAPRHAARHGKPNALALQRRVQLPQHPDRGQIEVGRAERSQTQGHEPGGRREACENCSEHIVPRSRRAATRRANTSTPGLSRSLDGARCRCRAWCQGRARESNIRRSPGSA